MRTLAVVSMSLLLPLGAVWAADDAPSGAAARDARTGADARGPDADNTGRNVRDRDDRNPTPMDQSNSEQDLAITQRIRREVTDHDGLSVNAQNVKIITQDGVVVLRGPVASAEEKSTIASIARGTAGVKRVDDRLEVERNR